MHQWEEAKTMINLIFQNNVNKYFFLKKLSMIVIFPLIVTDCHIFAEKKIHTLGLFTG